MRHQHSFKVFLTIILLALVIGVSAIISPNNARAASNPHTKPLAANCIWQGGASWDHIKHTVTLRAGTNCGGSYYWLQAQSNIFIGGWNKGGVATSCFSCSNTGLSQPYTYTGTAGQKGYTSFVITGCTDADNCAVILSGRFPTNTL